MACPTAPMALAVDPWMMWLLPLVLLVLSVLLTSLCSYCNRHTFELRDSALEKSPSVLISVVRLEDSEARDNPIMSDIQKGKDSAAKENSVHTNPWKDHLGAPQVQEHGCEEDSSVEFPVWRSHLREPQS